MKHSIRYQLLFVYMGGLALVIGIVAIVNTIFLEQYYIQYKQQDMEAIYSALEEAAEEGELSDAEVKQQVQAQSERANVSVTVMNQNSEVVFYTEQEKRGDLFSQLFGYLTGKNQGTLLESTDDYRIYKAKNFADGLEYLEVVGQLSDSSVFIMQTSLENIRDSVGIANSFLLKGGSLALLLGALFVWYLSGRLTSPILELVRLSKQVEHLDFHEKYTNRGKNEIDVLGESFNTMSERLEQSISELKQANNQLMKDIEQKEKNEDLRTEFLGNVSHELKTPIALIQGYAEGLKEEVNEDSENREFYCDVIMDEAAKMNQLVKQLLTLNQLEYGVNQSTVERFDLLQLVQGVVSSCDILVSQKQATVEIITEEPLLPGQMVAVWADELQTEQVFRNYLTNAINHVSGENRIEIRISRRGEVARVSVFNSGQPIPEEDLGKIWDKFYKVDKAHTREYGGNGVGLSIVKAIMESMHQAYGVENFENGVQFWFELDAQQKYGDKEETEQEEAGKKEEETDHGTA